jgi:catechol 2,3-dioxygenase-like lactoylglutathione lyase family enzyme
MITLGVSNMRASIAFYEALGFTRKFCAAGEAVGDQLAEDVTLSEHPRPQAFRGVTLAWNCRTTDEVDAVLDFAIAKGASLLKPAHKTDYGGYSGYFPIQIIIPGKSWSHPASRWVKTGAFICRIELALMRGGVAEGKAAVTTICCR